MLKKLEKIARPPLRDFSRTIGDRVAVSLPGRIVIQAAHSPHLRKFLRLDTLVGWRV